MRLHWLMKIMKRTRDDHEAVSGKIFQSTFLFTHPIVFDRLQVYLHCISFFRYVACTLYAAATKIAQFSRRPAAKFCFQ